MNIIVNRTITTLILLCSINAFAVPISFTDSALFKAAISGYSSSTLDFESRGDNDLIVDGGTLGGISFNYATLAASGVNLQIHNKYSATSGIQYLGTDSGGVFLGGDAFSLSFAPVNALGLFIFSGDQLLDADISLAAGTMVASLSSAYESTLADGSYVYFLGLVDTANAFNGAAVASISGGNFEFNLDDITTAKIQSNQIPAPPVLALVLVGLLLLFYQRKRQF